MSTVDDKSGLLGSILNWLRKGYPDGVPTKDYFPLLALLRGRLSEAELDEIVNELTVSGHLPADRTAVVAAIERVARQQPTDDDLGQVAARLAAAGWPLAGALTDPRGESPAVPTPTGPQGTGKDKTPGGSGRPALVTSILDWLRAGYPRGIPSQDYIPLLALLRRRLTDEETVQVARACVESGHAPTGAADIGVLITKVTDEMPSEEDVNRVRKNLEAAGWPVVPLP